MDGPVFCKVIRVVARLVLVISVTVPGERRGQTDGAKSRSRFGVKCAPRRAVHLRKIE